MISPKYLRELPGVPFPVLAPHELSFPVGENPPPLREDLMPDDFKLEDTPPPASPSKPPIRKER